MMSPIDDVAKEIAQLINDKKESEALQKWKEETKDLKYFEAVILREKVHKIIDGV